MFVRQFQRRHFGTHLFLICTVQVPPLLDWLGKVKGVHGDFDLANDVMFGEAIKVVHRHHQGLAPHFLEWNLEGRKQCFPLTPRSGMIWQLALHAVEAGQELYSGTRCDLRLELTIASLNDMQPQQSDFDEGKQCGFFSLSLSRYRTVSAGKVVQRRHSPLIWFSNTSSLCPLLCFQSS